MAESKKYIIELTNDCNLRCEMCPRNYIDMEIGYMSEETWKDTLHNIPMDSTILPFWRGESTLHPDFCMMMEDLAEYKEVVITTNGTNSNLIINVLPYLSVVNVSIHGIGSYEGYLKIREYANGTKVIASRVEGELPFTANRIYKMHTTDGVWGKVDGMNGPPTKVCSRLSETVIAWNGDRGRCCYVWDTSAQNSVCDTCDQWVSDRTL